MTDHRMLNAVIKMLAEGATCTNTLVIENTLVDKEQVTLALRDLHVKDPDVHFNDPAPTKVQDGWRYAGRHRRKRGR